MASGPESAVGCSLRPVIQGLQVRTRSGHIFFVEIWSWNNFYGQFSPCHWIDPSRAVVSYRPKYGHFVLVNHFGSLTRKSVNRLTGTAQHDNRLTAINMIKKNSNKQIIVFTVFCGTICAFTVQANSLPATELIQVGQLSVTGLSMGTLYWLIALEACPGKVWIG